MDRSVYLWQLDGFSSLEKRPCCAVTLSLQKTVGYLQNPCGNLAYRCATCNNTHEAVQDEFDGRKMGEPRGFPCTIGCKIYRLHLHSLIDHHPTMTKGDCYKEMAFILGKAVSMHIFRGLQSKSVKKCIQHFLFMC